MMEITAEQYHEAALQYYRLLATFPYEWQSRFPRFKNYLSPANWSLIPDDVPEDAIIELSLTGAKRLEALYSPHARTLLHMYAIQLETRRGGLKNTS